MVMFGLNQDEIKNGYDRAEGNPDNISLQTISDSNDEDKHIGNFEAAGRGIQSASVDLMALTNKATGFDFGLDMTPDEFQKASVEINKGLQPPPEVTGWLGSHVIYPLTRVMTEAVPATLVGGPVAGASVVGGSTGNMEYETLKADGVDENTALKIGALTGVTNALGFVAPAAVGSTFLTKVATGAGINTVIGGTQRGATGKILADAGYDEMADQYKVLDGGAMVTDAVLGSAFGAFHGKGKSPVVKEDSSAIGTMENPIDLKETGATDVTPLPSDVDTALAANNLNQYEVDSAPGIPADLKTRNSHIAAMDTATRQLLNNEPVQVAMHFDEPNFVQKPYNEAHHNDIRSVAEDEGISTLIRDLNKSDRKGTGVFNKAGQEIQLSELYNSQLQDSRGNPISSTDTLEKVWPDRNLKGITTPDGKPISGDDTLFSIYQRFGDQEHIRDTELAQAEQVLLDDRFKNIRTPDGAKIKSTDTLMSVMEKYRDAPNLHDILDDLQGILKDIRTDQEIFPESPFEVRDPVVAQPEPVDNSSIEMPQIKDESQQGFADGVRQFFKNTTGFLTGKKGEAPENNAQAQGKIEHDPTKEIIAEKPELNIVDDDGNIISAVDAIKKADEELAQAEKDANLFQVAVNCFLRSGDA